MEALFAILSADRHTTLEEILTDAKTLLPENVVQALVGEAYNRLNASTQAVMQALAVHARPVPFAAIDYVLQPHLPGVDSAPVLNLLVNMHFVRIESGRYYLHPVDQAYALSRLPRGRATDRKAEKIPPSPDSLSSIGQPIISRRPANPEKNGKPSRISPPN